MEAVEGLRVVLDVVGPNSDFVLVIVDSFSRIPKENKSN